MEKDYRLNDFNDEDITVAKSFIKKAILGFVSISIDLKVDEFFDSISEISFNGDDTFELNFKINTLGNDIIAAIGAAKNEREKPTDDD